MVVAYSANRSAHHVDDRIARRPGIARQDAVIGGCRDAAAAKFDGNVSGVGVSGTRLRSAYDDGRAQNERYAIGIGVRDAAWEICR